MRRNRSAVANRGLTLVVIAALLVPVTALAARKPPRFAVVVDGPSDLFNNSVRQLAMEVQALVQAQHSNYSFPAKPTHVGDFSLARTKTLLRQALSDSKVDVVLGFGFHIGVAVAQTEKLNKPVFLPFAAPELQGLPRSGDKSGRRNLSYLTGLMDLKREFRRFSDVIRRQRAVLLIDRVLYDAVPHLKTFTEDAVGDVMHTRLIPVEATAKEILAAIPKDAQGVYLGPFFRLPDAQIQPLIDGLNDRKLPSYASEGRAWVEKGAFTSLVPDDEVQSILRST